MIFFGGKRILPRLQGIVVAVQFAFVNANTEGRKRKKDSFHLEIPKIVPRKKFLFFFCIIFS